MSLVFISHVAEDSARAVQVATGIEDAGYTSWYYERDSLPGPTYLDQILAALARASAMIVLVSPAALASWQIDREVVQAYERGLPFLPLLFGLSHDEMHKARPAWAMAFGAAVWLPLPTGDVAPVLPRIVAGLRWLEDQADRHALPPRAPTSAPHSSVPAAPPTAPGEPITRLAAPSLLDKLPLPPTPLIGREREVEHVMALLWQDAVRLVTLTGPGGSGKTRLALQIAAESRPAFPDGVVFVNLAPLSDAALVLPAIAQALGVTEAGGQPLREAVPAFLHARRLLLVLDNYEQVIEAAPVAADLLASCPLLSVLATSRAPLRLRGEHEIAVAPLAVPDPTDLPDAPALAKVAAVALFVARA